MALRGVNGDVTVDILCTGNIVVSYVSLNTVSGVEGDATIKGASDSSDSSNNVGGSGITSSAFFEEFDLIGLALPEIKKINAYSKKN